MGFAAPGSFSKSWVAWANPEEVAEEVVDRLTATEVRFFPTCGISCAEAQQWEVCTSLGRRGHFGIRHARGGSA